MLRGGIAALGSWCYDRFHRLQLQHLLLSLLSFNLHIFNNKYNPYYNKKTQLLINYDNLIISVWNLLIISSTEMVFFILRQNQHRLRNLKNLHHVS